MRNYQHNISKNKEAALGYSEELKSYSILRIGAFLFSFFFIIIFVNAGLSGLLWGVVPLCVLGFGSLINQYNKIAYKKRHHNFLAEINEKELLRLENRLVDFQTGKTFMKQDHPYVTDLDIFGSHSIYQLLNRSTTESGHVCLAEWLSEPASKEVIEQRQEAIKELSPQLEWRQDFQASGMHFRNEKSDYNKLLAWVEKPVQLLPKQTKYLVICILLAVLSTAALIHHFLFAYTSGYLFHTLPLIIVLGVNYLVLSGMPPCPLQASCEWPPGKAC